jgi:hypothetical protein
MLGRGRRHSLKRVIQASVGQIRNQLIKVFWFGAKVSPKQPLQCLDSAMLKSAVLVAHKL